MKQNDGNKMRMIVMFEKEPVVWDTDTDENPPRLLS